MYKESNGYCDSYWLIKNSVIYSDFHIKNMSEIIAV